MYSLKIENKAGQQFELTSNEARYQVTKIDGLNPPPAVITSAGVAGMDGSRFASAKLGERNLVLYVKINGDVETNRIFLYRFFKTKQYCKIYYENETRSVYAEGYVETIECDLFENGQMMQISIVCNDPYLKALEEIEHELSLIIGAFTFPFAIEEPIEFSYYEHDMLTTIAYDGDAESGFIIEIQAGGSVTNPSIYKVGTGEQMSINVTMVQGDLLRINTNKGEKSIEFTHNGVTTNYLRNLQRGSSWLSLDIGDNQFTCDADSGEEMMQIVFKYRTKYEGV